MILSQATMMENLRPGEPKPAVSLPDSHSAAAQSNCPTYLRLSIVIPVFNERETLAEIVRRVREAPGNKEIILVDDGSTDGTRELLRLMSDDPDLRVVLHSENRGKGAALRTGFLRVTGDIVIIQDADLEYDPADYPRLIEPIVQNRADVVFGSRFLEGTAGMPASRKWHNRANRWLTSLSNVFTGLRLTDMETCYKVLRADIVKILAPKLEQNRFGIEPEMTARLAAAKYRIAEVAIRYRARGKDEGKKIGWRDGIQAVWCIVRYWRCK